MRTKHRLAWRLSGVVTVVVALVVVVVGLLGNLLSRHFALEVAQEVMQFNSSSVRSGIHELMMSRNNAAVLELVENLSRGTTTYLDMRLISHPSGEIAVSRLPTETAYLDQEDPSCAQCHGGGKLPKADDEPRQLVFTNAEGERVLQIVTPILNEASCQSADCHAHSTAPPVLGFLQVDYSLWQVDALISHLNRIMVVAALTAVVVTTLILILMFRHYLHRPLSRLVRGLTALAEKDMSFRFSAVRDDEIGLVEESFNRMADRLESHQVELKETLEYLESIVENSADLIITVTPDDLIRTFNRGAETALGYKREEVIGQRIGMLFANPKEREAAILRLQDTDNVTNFETRFLTKGGNTRHILLTLSRLRDRYGNPIGTLGISKDITTERELQRKLIQATRVAAIGQAVTSIQHAIKNMLNTLRGGLYVVRVGEKKEKWERVAEGSAMIEEGLTRISDLSLNMLKYAREWKIDPRVTDLASLLKSIIEAVSQSAEKRGILIHTEFSREVPAFPVDSQLIHACLMDIVTNALEACEMKEYGEDGRPEITLRLSLSPDGDQARIDVEDNGVGMPPEVAAQVFAPFFSTKDKWGTGLGLALAARIVDLHDGTIQVESEVDKGTRFRIVLPLEAP